MKRVSHYWWALLFFTAATVVMTFPLAFRMTDSVRSYGDQTFIIWNLAWDAHALRENPLNFFNGNIFYPQKNAVALSDSLASEMILAFPIILFTNNPILAGNVLILASFIMSGMFMYLFAYRLTRSTWGALVAGSIYAFSAYRIAHSVHINSLQMQWMPLAMYFLHRFYETDSRKHLVSFTVFFLLNVFARWDYGFYFGVYVLGYIVVRIVLEPQKGLRRKVAHHARRVRRLCWAMFVGMVVTAPLYVSTIQAYLDEPTHIRTIWEVQSFAARLTDYFTVVEVPSNWLYRHFPVISTDGTIERSLFIGLLPIPLLLLALWKIRQDKNVRLFSLLGLMSFILSFGPFPVVRGYPIPFPLPYAFLFYLFPPFRSVRVPTRFSAFVMFSVAVLSGLTVWWINERYGTKRFRKMLFGGGVLFLVLFESFAAPWPLVRLPQPTDFPLVYHWLKDQAPKSVVLELPVSEQVDVNVEKKNAAHRGKTVTEEDLLTYDWPFPFYEAARMYYSTLHWQPLVNGYSSFFPKTYEDVRRKFYDFPTQEGIEFGKQLGIRYYVVHEKEFVNWQDIEQRLLNMPSLALVGIFGDDRVYEYREKSSP